MDGSIQALEDGNVTPPCVPVSPPPITNQGILQWDSVSSFLQSLTYQNQNWAGSQNWDGGEVVRVETGHPGW